MKSNLKPRKPDFILSIPVVILLGLGMVMVYSASGVQSKEVYGDQGFIFFKQFTALIAGLIGLTLTLLVPHHFYRRKPILFLGLLTVLGLLIGVLFQTEAKGAHRWYYFSGFGFQPSELAKILLVIFVAAYGTAFGKDPRPWSKRLKMIIPVLTVFCGLILLQPDFGATMIILFLVGMMLFLAGLPIRFLVLGGILLLPIAAGLVMTEGYRLKRIKDYLFVDHYHTKQAKLAVGSGGLTGVGLGEGKQKLYYLPEPHTDFIFATLCEEFGFVGALALLLCYLFFLLRGVYVLKRVESPYSRLLGTGLLMLLIIQAFINMSITLGILPNKGLTLPFISAGGTSLLMSLCMFGMILNISRWQIQDNRVVS